MGFQGLTDIDIGAAPASAAPMSKLNQFIPLKTLALESQFTGKVMVKGQFVVASVEQFVVSDPVSKFLLRCDNFFEERVLFQIRQ